MKSFSMIKLSIATALAFLPCLIFNPNQAQAINLKEHNQVLMHINRGTELLSRRLYHEAMDEYRIALKIDPHSKVAQDNLALVHNNLGTEYFNRHLYIEAQREWQQALRINPNSSLARNNLRVLSLHMRNRPNQQEEYEWVDEDEEDYVPANEEEKKESPLFPNLVEKKAKTSEKTDAKKKAPTVVILKLSANNTEKEDQEKVAAEEKEVGPQNSASQTDTAFDTTLQDYVDLLKEKEDKADKPESKAFHIVKADAETNKSISNKQHHVMKPEKVVEQKVEPETQIPERTKKIAIKCESSNGSFCDKIARLENEIFGKTKASQPILKRLSQLEKATQGKKQSGSIKDRIKKLNDGYGI